MPTFEWRRSKVGAKPTARIVHLPPSEPDTKAALKQMLIQSHVISDDEAKLGIDELSRKYPLR